MTWKQHCISAEDKKNKLGSSRYIKKPIFKLLTISRSVEVGGYYGRRKKGYTNALRRRSFILN